MGFSNKSASSVVISATLALAAIALLVTLLTSWSGARIDGVSIERQKELVSQVLSQRLINVGHEQETVTFVDMSVHMLTRPLTTAGDRAAVEGYIHNNLGVWMHSHFSHDEIYVLSGSGRPLYVSRDGQRLNPRAYQTIASVAQPMISELRRKMLRGEPPFGTLSTLGVADIAVIGGHPAIISVKPFLSRSGNLRQRPGTEPLHISVRRLDGTIVGALRDNYNFEGGRFSWSDNHTGAEASLPFISPRTGRTVGYFIWKPFAPGSVVLWDIAPGLCLTLLLIGAILWMLIRQIQRGNAQLQASEAQAKHLAYHDVLTGLPNRALFEDRLDRALAAARRHPEQQVALLYLDVDRFKQVNDTLGHAAGDELIRELARRLSGEVRVTDTVARLGGDEFAIVQTEVDSETDIQLLCERILRAVEAPFDVIGSRVFVGISIGVARSGLHALVRAELSRKADIALYHAKDEGRGRYAIFAENLDTTIQIRRSIEHELRGALSSGTQLELYYQPKYNAGSKAISGVEALVRWHHPDRGMICPSVFVPIAEECGLIERLGEWVLEEALMAAACWPVDSISVNVSAIQLRNQLFAKRVISSLEGAGMDPSRLELEITETSFLNNLEQCQANLIALREAGVRIALDDFGTSYSSFSHLQTHPVDRLKIDRSFTTSIEDSADGSAIVRAIIAVARSSGLEITAEGVETVEQSDFLCSIGCDELQGVLMSGPMPRVDLDRLLGVHPLRRGQQMEPPLAA